jgi:hypothetical protein
LTGTESNTLAELRQHMHRLWRTERPNTTIYEARAALAEARAEDDTMSSWTTAEWVAARDNDHARAIDQAQSFADEIAALRAQIIVCQTAQSRYSPMEPIYGDFGDLIQSLTAHIEAIEHMAVPPRGKARLERFKRDAWTAMAQSVRDRERTLETLEILWGEYELEQRQIQRVGAVLDDLAHITPA